MNVAPRQLTIVSSDDLASIPVHALNHGIVAVLSTPTAEDVADFFEPGDACDFTVATFSVDGEYRSESTYSTPRGNIAASERFIVAVKRALARLRKEVA